MARFDPHAYPDRLAFEAHAHRIRAEEMGKAFNAAATWLAAWQHGMTGRLRTLATSVAAHSTGIRRTDRVPAAAGRRERS